MKKLFKLFSILVVSCICVTSVANAETISNSYLSINSDTLSSLRELYYNSEYGNYVITSKRVYDNDYRYVSYYYVCLTNEVMKEYDPLNISVNCNVLYTIDSNGGIASKSNDSLVISNSNYYSSNNERATFKNILNLVCISAIVLFVMDLLAYALDKLFSIRGGGFKYEDI